MGLLEIEVPVGVRLRILEPMQSAVGLSMDLPKRTLIAVFVLELLLLIL